MRVDILFIFYFNNLGVQNYINKLKKVISALKADELKSAENKIKVVALKATTNINSLIKDFFKIPPAYKTTIQLSFKQATNAKQMSTLSPIAAARTSITVVSPTTETVTTDDGGTTPGAKKRAPITAPEGVPEPKRDRKFYTPPSGKFSGGGGSGGFKRFSGTYSRGGRGGGFKGGRNSGKNYRRF